MANKRKILEAARKHAQKGAKERALKEYEKLLKLDPKDARLRIEIGDAYRRWGQVADAIATYAKVAQQYMSDGFDARAVAVFKQIHNLDPEHWPSYEPLGELYQRMGLTAEAINTLQTAADGHHRSGNKREALELLRKMATIDPSNTASRLKVADLLHQESMNDEAIAEYQAAVEELSRQGEHEQAGRGLERILEIDPRHASALPKLVDNLIARGLHEQAEPFAKRTIEESPDEPNHYERLAEVYRAQQREDALEDIYRRLAEVYRQRGDDGRARDIIQRFVSPNSFEVQSEPEIELGNDEVLESDVSEFLSDEELGPETLLEDEFIVAGDSASEVEPMRPPVVEETVLARGADASASDDALALEEIVDLDDPLVEDSQPSLEVMPDLGAVPPPEPAPEGDPDQLLAEACVYLRYGKRAQAISNLQAILDTEPGHRRALEKLGEAHAEGDEPELAVAQWMKAAEYAREAGDAASLAVLRDRIGALDEVAAGSLAPGIGETDPALDLEVSDSDIDGSGVDSEIEDGSTDDLDLDDLEIGVDDSEIDAELEGSEIDDSELVDSQLDASVSDLQGIDDLDLDLVTGENLDAGESCSDGLAGGEIEGDLQSSVSGAPPSASLSVQISEDLEEADFYVQQGLLDEAEAIYRRILDGAPNHPQALVRLGEIAATRGEDPSLSSGNLAADSCEPEELLDVPDIDECDPVEGPSEGVEVPVDLDEWTDGGGDGLDLEVVDPDPGIAAASPVDPNAETDIDFDIDVESEDGMALSETANDDDEAAPEDNDSPEEELASPDLEDDLDLDDDPEEEPGAPDSADVSDVFADLDLSESPKPVPVAPPVSDASLEGGFDLAAELSDAFDNDAKSASVSGSLAGADDGFAAVFQEFKKGVQDALSDGDHQAHYDLGIAYREMGLLDDAMGEFRSAMADEGRRLDCLQMLGLCSLERECGEDAVAHFQQALALDGLGDEQVLALRFDLGRAFESLGEVEEARAVWEAVAAADDSFCDIAERLASLEESEKPDAAPEFGADTSPTESFETFDDLIGETEASERRAHVDFDDLVAEANADEEADSREVADPVDDDADGESGDEDFDDLMSDVAADAEASLPDVEPAQAPVSETERQDEPAVEPEPEPVPEKPRRKKKKISFV